jgi:hypothetical protein
LVDPESAGDDNYIHPGPSGYAGWIGLDGSSGNDVIYFNGIFARRAKRYLRDIHGPVDRFDAELIQITPWHTRSIAIQVLDSLNDISETSSNELQIYLQWKDRNDNASVKR